MPKYAADIAGVPFNFEAPDDATAGRMVAAEAYKRGAKAQAPPPPGLGFGETVADVAKSAASGVGRGVVSIPGMVGDIPGLIEKGVNALDQKVSGRTDEQQAAHAAARRAAAPLGNLPDLDKEVTTEALINRMPDIGLNYQPKTAVGQGVQTVGEMLPGAVIPGQAAVRGVSAGQRAARAGVDAAKFAVAPGIAAEGAGAVTDDNPYAKAAAATATALATGRVRDPSAATPVPGTHPQAVARVNRAIEDEGGFPVVRQDLNELGEGAMLADVGTNPRGQADAITNQPGPGARPLLDAVRARHLAAGDRTTAAVNTALGDTMNFADETQRLMAERRAVADTLYGAARAHAGPVDTSGVVAAIESMIPHQTIAAGTAALPHEASLLRIREQLQGRTDINSLHSLKVSLDDQIANAVREGSNAQASQLITVRDALVRRLDNATIDPRTGRSLYGEARAQYAGDSAVLAAREMGQTLFSREQRADEFARQWRDMSETERRGLQQGARDQVEMLMDNARNDAASARSLFDKNANQRKLAIVIGEDRANQLLRFLDGEARKQGTYSTLTGNSRTAGRQAAQEEFPSSLQQKPVSEIPSVTQLPMLLLNRGVEALARTHGIERNRAIATDTARMLGTTGADQALMLQQLEEAYRQRQRFNPRPLMPAMAGETQVNEGRPLELRVRPLNAR